MISKITLLEATCLISGVLIPACLVALAIVAFKKTKISYRVPFALLVIATLSFGYSYLELERIHGLFFEGNYQIKKKADLLDLFGEPTRTFSEDFKGKRIDAWVYKIDLINPKLAIQFEFDGEDYVGAMGQIKPPSQ
jgi:hypothetical protein